MSKKIMGVTVGTSLSPSKIEEKIKPIKTVNNVAPDENGNVEIEIPQVANGKSAYEIVLEYGYDGTEEEWANGLNPDKLVEKVLDTMEQAEDFTYGKTSN